MRTTLTSICRIVLLCMLWLLAARTARAEDKTQLLTIDFDVDPSERPSTLCVVSHFVQGNVTTQMIAPPQGTWYAPEQSWVFSKPLEPWSPAVPPAPPVDDEVARRVADAVEQMRIDKLGSGCTSRLCAPRVVFQEEDLDHPPNVDCRRDAQGNDRDARVVVLFVRPLVGAELKPKLTRIEFSHTVASLSWYFKNGKTVDAEISATVIGAHYAEGRTHTDRKKISLPLVPRFRTHEIQLPPIAGPAAMRPRVTLQVARGEEVEEVPLPMSVAMDHRSLHGALPSADGKKILTVTVGEPWDPYYTRLVADWDTFEAPTVVVPRVEAVSFRWKRHCLYSSTSACPVARLPEVGIQCDEQPLELSDECAYRCARAPGAAAKSAAHVTFNFPVRVRFQRRSDGPHEDTWEDTLNYSNQILTSYVPLEQRYIDLDLSSWTPAGRATPALLGAAGSGVAAVLGAAGRTVAGLGAVMALTFEEQVLPSLEEQALRRLVDRYGDSVREVVLTAPSGRLYTVAPHLGQRIEAPGVICDEILKYTLTGDRAYGVGTVRVTEGRLTLDHPNAAALWFSPGVRLSAGGLWHRYPHSNVGFNSNVGFTGGADVAPIGGVEALLSLRPPGWPVTLEARPGYALSQQTYFSLTAEATGTSSVWYHRFPLTVAMLGHVADVWYIGLDAGGEVGVTTNASDGARAGKWQSFGRIQTLFGWIVPGRYSSIELSAMLGYGEKVYGYYFSSDNHAAVLTETYKPLLFGLDAAVLFGRR